MKEILLQRYPYLAQFPDDAPGIDAPVPPPPRIFWAGLGSIIGLNPQPMAEETPVSNEDIKSEGTSKEVDQAATNSLEGGDMENIPTTWHDVCLSIAAELMGKVREDIRANLGYSTSAVSCLLLDDLLTLTMFDIDRVLQEISFLLRFVFDG